MLRLGNLFKYRDDYSIVKRDPNRALHFFCSRHGPQGKLLNSSVHADILPRQKLINFLMREHQELVERLQTGGEKTAEPQAVAVQSPLLNEPPAASDSPPQVTHHSSIPGSVDQKYSDRSKSRGASQSRGSAVRTEATDRKSSELRCHHSCSAAGGHHASCMVHQNELKQLSLSVLPTSASNSFRVTLSCHRNCTGASQHVEWCTVGGCVQFKRGSTVQSCNELKGLHAPGCTNPKRPAPLQSAKKPVTGSKGHLRRERLKHVRSEAKRKAEAIRAHLAKEIQYEEAEGCSSLCSRDSGHEEYCPNGACAIICDKQSGHGTNCQYAEAYEELNAFSLNEDDS